MYLGELDLNSASPNVRFFEKLHIENKFAIKEISNAVLKEKLGDRGQEALKKEIEISKLLNQKNIIKLYDIIKTERNNYLVFEFCGGGDLRSYLREKKRLSEPVA